MIKFKFSFLVFVRSRNSPSHAFFLELIEAHSSSAPRNVHTLSSLFSASVLITSAANKFFSSSWRCC